MVGCLHLASRFSLVMGVMLTATCLPAGSETPDIDSVTVTDAEFRKFSGKLTSLNESRFRIDSQGEEFELSNTWRMEWPGHAHTSLDDSPTVVLANGDRIGIQPIKIDDEALYGRWNAYPSFPELQVPLETIRGGVLIASRNLLEQAATLVRIREQSEHLDIFYLANGDLLTGQFERMNEGEINLMTVSGPVVLKQNSIRAFGFNPELTSFPKSGRDTRVLTLTDGSVLTLKSVTLLPNQELICLATCGTKFQIPIDQVYSIDFYGARVVALSELTPKSIESIPYLTRKWPLRVNLNAAGGPLRISGKESSRGLGMHGENQVVYDLNGEYQSFHAKLGIDDVAAKRGSVVFKVLVDSKAAFESQVIRGRSDPVTVGPLAISGARQLTLIVNVADQGDILDHADWCDATLVRTSVPLDKSR